MHRSSVEESLNSSGEVVNNFVYPTKRQRKDCPESSIVPADATKHSLPYDSSTRKSQNQIKATFSTFKGVELPSAHDMDPHSFQFWLKVLPTIHGSLPSATDSFVFFSLGQDASAAGIAEHAGNYDEMGLLMTQQRRMELIRSSPQGPQFEWPEAVDETKDDLRKDPNQVTAIPRLPSKSKNCDEHGVSRPGQDDFDDLGCADDGGMAAPGQNLAGPTMLTDFTKLQSSTSVSNHVARNKARKPAREVASYAKVSLGKVPDQQDWSNAILNFGQSSDVTVLHAGSREQCQTLLDLFRFATHIAFTVMDAVGSTTFRSFKFGKGNSVDPGLGYALSAIVILAKLDDGQSRRVILHGLLDGPGVLEEGSTISALPRQQSVKGNIESLLSALQDDSLCGATVITYNLLACLRGLIRSNAIDMQSAQYSNPVASKSAKRQWCHCLQLISWLNDSSRGDQEYCSVFSRQYQSVQCLMPSKHNDFGPSLELRIEAAFQDLSNCLEEFPNAVSVLENKGAWPAYANTELPLVEVLQHMEFLGIRFDGDHLQGKIAEINAKLKGLDEDSLRLIGKTILLSSPQQVSQVLFDDLKLPAVRQKGSDVVDSRTSKTKDKKLDLSSGNDVLVALKDLHPFPGIVLAHRSLNKLLTSFLIPLLGQHKSTSSSHASKIIRTVFSQTATSTGRLACSQPNLQQMPSSDHEDFYGVRVNIREAFKPREGKMFLAGDFEQCELRIMAHYSQDSHLIDLFSKGTDVYKQIASSILSKPTSAVNQQERKLFKTVVLGIIYGIGPKSISEKLEITQEEAQKNIRLFLWKFKGVSKFMRAVHRDAKEKGYVTTFHGRRRPLPDIHSEIAARRSYAERQAVNTVIQGTAADIAKQCMLILHRRIRDCPVLGRGRADLVLQIHDELLFEVDKDCVVELALLVQQTMQTLAKLRVQLPVKICTGESWGNLCEFNQVSKSKSNSTELNSGQAPYQHSPGLTKSEEDKVCSEQSEPVQPFPSETNQLSESKDAEHTQRSMNITADSSQEAKLGSTRQENALFAPQSGNGLKFPMSLPVLSGMAKCRAGSTSKVSSEEDELLDF